MVAIFNSRAVRSGLDSILTPRATMNLLHAFTAHPASVNETYAQHFRVSAGVGLAMLGGGLACLVHALLPFAFTTRGSETIAKLHDRIVASRRGIK